MGLRALPCRDLPEIETDATVTPVPHDEPGVKRIGEAGPIAAPPALVDAVCDALDVDHLDVPLRGETIWRASRA